MKQAGQIVLVPFPFTDFAMTGLKVPSVLRLTRLAVLESSLLVGSLGSISDEQLQRIRQKLAIWIAEDSP